MLYALGIRGELSDRLNVVQQEMIAVRDRHEILEEVLRGAEFRKSGSRVLEIQMALEARHRGRVTFAERAAYGESAGGLGSDSVPID
jgi:hypothetical protein